MDCGRGRPMPEVGIGTVSRKASEDARQRREFREEITAFLKKAAQAARVAGRRVLQITQ